jgi:hypothetical protein
VGLGILNSVTTSGWFNVGVGLGALHATTTGIENVAIGSYALYQSTTGVNNTAVGTYSMQNSVEAHFNTALGNKSLYSNTMGRENVAVGVNALFTNTTGRENVAVGLGALYTNATGYANTAIGLGADVSSGDLSNATAIGAGARVDASNKIRLGNGGVSVIEGRVPFTYSSDAASKENFKPVDGEEFLRKLSRFNLTTWNYIGHEPKQLRHYGPMAQDFYAAFGHDGIGTIGTPTTITSGDMTGVLMIITQALEKRTAALQAENADLKSRLERLESFLLGGASN